jgi:hypothetical protein
MRQERRKHTHLFVLLPPAETLGDVVFIREEIIRPAILP